MRKTRTYTNYFWDVPFKQHLNVCHEPDPYIWEKKGLPPYESLNLCSFDALKYKTRYYYNSRLVWLAWQFKKLLTNLKIYKLFHATTIFHSPYLWANFRAIAAGSCRFLLKTILLDLCQNHLDVLHYMSVPCVCSLAKLKMPYIFGQNIA